MNKKLSKKPYRRGPQPDFMLDKMIYDMYEKSKKSGKPLTFRALAKVVKRDVKNVYIAYTRHKSRVVG